MSVSGAAAIGIEKGDFAKLSVALPAVTNWDPRNNLQKTRAALNRVRAGQGNMVINLYGHSAIAGVGGGTLQPGGQYIVGAEPYSVGAALARGLNGYGVPARRGGWFGMGNLGALADFLAFDPRITAGSGWVKPTGGVNTNSFGGAMPANLTTTATAWAFTPTESWDRLDTYYAVFSGGGTFTVDTGGAALTTQSVANATTNIAKVTTSAASDAIQAANLKLSTLAGGVYLVGQESYRSGKSEARVRTIGWNGATSGTLIATDKPFSTLNALSFVGGDLTVIECMRNDQSTSVPVATFQANLQTIVTTAKANGDVILLVDHAPLTWTFTNDAALVAAIYAVGSANNVPVVDITRRIGDGAAATALSYFCPDNVHYNATGWGDIGAWLAQLLACRL